MSQIKSLEATLRPRFNKILKKINIKLTKKLNKARRESLTIKTYELKLNNVSNSQHKHLKECFREAKYIYNHLVSTYGVYEKLKEVPVKVGKEVEIRPINHLSSQMKQGISDKFTGKKYVKEYKTIFLKQFGSTYNFIGNKLRLQGIKQLFYVRGLKQLNGEISTAELMKKASGYYLKVVAYVDEKIEKSGSIGIDFGVKNPIVCSDGLKFELNFEHLKKLEGRKAGLQRKLAKQKKGGKNYFKTSHKINLVYEKIVNMEKESINKTIAYFKKYENIYVQDEGIKGWKERWGSKLHFVPLGRMMARIKKLDTVVLGKYKATTKTCSNCGNVQEMALKDRIYSCKCGLKIDRDVNAGINMILMGGGNFEITDRKPNLDGVKLMKINASGTEDVKCLQDKGYWKVAKLSDSNVLDIMNFVQKQEDTSL